MVKRKSKTPTKNAAAASATRQQVQETSRTTRSSTQAQQQQQQIPTTSNQAKKKPRKKAKMYVKTLREIRQLQRTTNLLIPRMPFLRLIREIMQTSTGENYRITVMAVEAIREAAESYLIGTLEDSYQLAIHAKRVTLMPRDVQLLIKLRNNVLSDMMRQ